MTASLGNRVLPYDMHLTSPAFRGNEQIPSEYGADGPGMPPPLRVCDVPTGTLTLALVVQDPDIPRAKWPSGIFNHWVVWNLPASLTELLPGRIPPGDVGLSSYGTHAYIPPAPPVEHRYYFYLYALDVRLDLPVANTAADDLFAAMVGHVLEVSCLMGRYTRVASE